MDLRGRANEKLKQSQLPVASPERVWAGPGTGNTCSLCDRGIENSDVEYECQFGSEGDGLLALRFHVTCYAVWQVERGRPQH